VEVLEAAKTDWEARRYDRAAEIYEAAIAENPEAIWLYWHFGLALLLQGEEEAAQLAWMTPLMEAEAEVQLEGAAELLRVLAAEADRQEALPDLEMARTIRLHAREIDPENTVNLLHLARLSLAGGERDLGEEILTETLELQDGDRLETEDEAQLWLQTLDAAIAVLPFTPAILDFARTCSDIIGKGARDRLYQCAGQLQREGKADAAIELVQICLDADPDNVYYAELMAHALYRANRYTECLEAGERYLQIAPHVWAKIEAYHVIAQALLTLGGQSERARAVHEEIKRLLFSPEIEGDIEYRWALKLIVAGSHSYYFNDDPQANYTLRDRATRLLSAKLHDRYDSTFQTYQNTIALRRQSGAKKLKIGYLSEFFRDHSIGWLVRWIFKYHDRDRFDIRAYTHPRTEDWLSYRYKSQYCPDELQEVPYSIEQTANRIHDDGIDILVHLDSITSTVGVAVTALKPAPLQITWLGFDASAMPTVDYYLADDYSLPPSMQQYYNETIWRLPQTYLAVDGFEVGTPTLRREDLDIPEDAIVYFSSQTGFKRHANNARLQMQILDRVPDSYFLVKGLGTDRDLIANFFYEIAAEVGVSSDRLRFLDPVPSSLTHRANLAIADVVLDTYPYNGTTTTLETLWMGIPVVSQVGQQFSSRQGYTLLKNVGVEAGIAYTDAEYVEWGVKLGCDKELRSRVAFQLWQARRHSPLWNAKEFTRQLEIAYEQMWDRWIGGLGG